MAKQKGKSQPLSCFMNVDSGSPLSSVPCLTTNAVSPAASVKTIKSRGYQIPPINQTDIRQILVLLLLFIREGKFPGGSMVEEFNKNLKQAMALYTTRKIANQAKYQKRGETNQLKHWLAEFAKLPNNRDPLEMVQYAIHIEAAFDFGVSKVLNAHGSVMNKVDPAISRILEGLFGVVSATLVSALDDTAIDIFSGLKNATGDERLEVSLLEKELEKRRPDNTGAGDHLAWDYTLEALFHLVRDEEKLAGLQASSGFSNAVRFAHVIDDFIKRHQASSPDEEAEIPADFSNYYAISMQHIMRPVSGRPGMKLIGQEKLLINSFPAHNTEDIALFSTILAPVSVRADLKFVDPTTADIASIGVAQNHAVMALAQLLFLVIHALMGEDASHGLYKTLQTTL